MARDKVEVLLPAQDVTQSIEVGKITKKAVTQANGIYIEDALKNKNNSLQIYVENTTTSGTLSATSTLTIKAGNHYPNKMLGDLSVALGAGEITAIILDDISRFENKDGSINLDFASGFTGNVWAVAKRAGIKPVA
ncbi:hypothetical protein IJI31_06455 [bacterium]|nr:hypothetical protein [bacterium]